MTSDTKDDTLLRKGDKTSTIDSGYLTAGKHLRPFEPFITQEVSIEI